MRMGKGNDQTQNSTMYDVVQNTHESDKKKDGNQIKRKYIH
jgi:hypothetical protein